MKNTKHYLQVLLKEIILFLFCGGTYALIEVIYKGTERGTHWSMFVLAGFCGCLFIDGLNNMFSYEIDFLLQIFMCMILVTVCEYYVGCAVNKDYFIWDYRNVWMNYKGQICLPFTLAWGLISTISIPILDFVEWKVFKYKHETPPYYKVFGKKIFQFK